MRGKIEVRPNDVNMEEESERNTTLRPATQTAVVQRIIRRVFGSLLSAGDCDFTLDGLECQYN